MGKRRLITGAMAVLTAVFSLFSQDLNGKKVLFIESYHQGYPWSDGLVSSVTKTLEPTGVTLEIVRMDTKRNTDEAFKAAAGEKVIAKIEEMKPDVIIASDDNASHYVIAKKYKNSPIPVVFCGINWDASAYGFPCSNVTGMIEVAPAKQLVGYLKKHAQGDKVGYLAADNETEHKEVSYMTQKFGISFETQFVKNFDEWKKAFTEMQNSVDMLILGVYSGIKGWDDKAARTYAVANTNVPTGAMYDYLADMALLALTKKAEEHGEFAALSAIQILKGKKPSDIPVAMNTKSDIFVNMKLAQKLNVEFDVALLKIAKIVK